VSTGRPPLTIDRCVCHQVTFATLLPLAQAHGCTSLDALQAHATFGKTCKLCHPYVRRMLTTGETTFHEVVTE
jgi:bacterioferritin-associated ferredoxin